MAELTIEQKKALARARARLKLGAPKTGIVDQAGSGVNEGIARAAGLPVDAVTGAINMALPEAWEIKNPVGGSESLLGLFDPLISDAQPQTRGQRYARRIGQEVGGGAVMAPAMAFAPGIKAAASAAPGAYMAASTAGDVGAGIAGQTSQEIAPGNGTVDLIASMIGGGLGAGAASMMTPNAPATTIDDVRRMEASKWAGVRAAPDRLTDEATGDLRAAVKGTLPTSQLAPDAYPQAFKMASRLDDVQNPTISEVADLRRVIGDSVASLPGEAGQGVAMKKAISDYLDQIEPQHVTGGTGEVAGDVKVANALSARSHRYDSVLNKEMRGETAAATSGTGGNEVNATRQRIRALFDIERDPTLKGRRQGFTPAEMKQMETVVMGTKGQNIARLLGRLAPTSGALPFLATGVGGASGATAALMGGSPALAIPAAAGGIGFVAKELAEGMNKREIARLLTIIANGGPVKKSAGKSAAQAAIAAQLAESYTRGQQQ